jgi:hypothetical protein
LRVLTDALRFAGLSRRILELTRRFSQLIARAHIHLAMASATFIGS